MNFSKNLTFYAGVLVLLLVSYGCSSTSMVRTNPPGGDVYQVDADTGREAYLGREPVQIEGRVLKTYYLRAEKNDYQGTATVKAREVDPGRAALGCLACGVPGLLGAGLTLPDQITIQMYELDSDEAEKEQIIEPEPSEDDGPQRLE